ncbi:MAG: bifunctional riboflavin kinase/FAD synthetase [Deltaproteobacteria bacterium]|nr:bifunctional riboflavin kinase/FAD synthetase [Deltaproteobacteria bacterium]
MAILTDLNQLETPLKNPVLTIGNFDGVHRGHLTLFALVKKRAQAIGGESMLMTFDPHPIKVMKPGNGPPLITLTRQKLQLIEKENIDTILCIPFTPEFAAIEAEAFVQELLVGKIGIKEIVVGYDYSFGRNREGNMGLLREMGATYGFKVHKVEPVHIDGTLVSSTRIRELVQAGRLPEARTLLGRHYQICGTVVKGRDRGAKLLGYPTANLELIDELIPKLGVYAVRVHVADEIYDGVTNIGYNPTFGKGPFSVETHILNFDRNLAGEEIRVSFLEKLRDEKTFGSVKDLADEIAKDILRARELFRKHTENP